MPELFVEFFSEEIPARMQLRAAEDLKLLSQKFLGEAGFSEPNIETFVTPRRLVLVTDLPAQQPDRAEEIKGPRVDAPEQALNGFMQANGLQSLGGVEQRAVGKATHYLITRNEKGRATAEVLPEIIAQISTQFPWPKSMRWGAGTQTWVRPLHAVNVVFDGKLLSRHSRVRGNDAIFVGHRFLSPKPFAAKSFEEYKTKLREHYVILDQFERRKTIEEQIQYILEANPKWSWGDNLGLIDELIGLVEWPVVALGRFDEAFLSLPSHVIVETMRQHQKYLHIFDVSKQPTTLAARFIFVANITVNEGIIAGNERVLRARLSDAKFFYEQDKKEKLETRIEKLKTIQFHEKLGTLHERVGRISGIAQRLATALGADVQLAARAAELCKADLTTGMVGEFPELQGIMGRYYALHDGENAAVADAIRDHYQPLGPTAPVPNAPISIVVALADKLHTLNEFFKIGEKPTGSKDPYALRRAALGVIRIILENKLSLPLSDFVQPEVLEFIQDRLQVALREQGISAGQVRAVMAGNNLLGIAERAAALSEFLSTAKGKAVQAAYSRAANILRAEEKKDKTSYESAVKREILTDAAEKKLFQALMEAEAKIRVENTLAIPKNQVFLDALAEVQPVLESFFADVMVNAEIVEVRANRLNLLGQIRRVFHQFADFSQLEG